MDPIIFIPGFPASELYNNRTGKRIFPLTRFALGMDDSQVPDFQTRHDEPDHVIATRPFREFANLLGFPLVPAASTLYELLAEYGYVEHSGDFQPFGWDWRLPVNHPRIQDALRSLLDQLTAEPPGRQAILLVHSTGGLVLREFFLNPAHAYLKPRVRDVIALGVPWAGTLASLLKVVGREGLGPIKKAHVQKVVGHASAAYDLLPLNLLDHHDRLSGPGTPPVLANAASKKILDDECPPDPVNGKRYPENARVRIRATRDRTKWTKGLRITNVAGWGERTLVYLDLGTDAAGGLGISDRRTTIKGDGTIPFESAKWLDGAQVTNLSACLVDGQVHRNIWNSDAGLSAIDAVLHRRTPEPTATIGTDLVNASSRPAHLALVIYAGLSGRTSVELRRHRLVVDSRTPGAPEYFESVGFDADGVAVVDMPRGYFRGLNDRLQALTLRVEIQDSGDVVEGRTITISWRGRSNAAMTTRRER